MTQSTTPHAGAEADGPALGQAGKVADVLRLRVVEGLLPPGTRMSEEALVKQLNVSRNTLREAFRLLTHDGLLVHRFNRGVFVPELGRADLADIYRLRMLVEPHVVRSLSAEDTLRLDPLHEAVLAAEDAARHSSWVDVVTANMHFHRGLVALAGSPRLDALARRLLAELRLIFHVIDEPQHVYEPYVSNNRYLYTGLRSGRFEDMADYLRRYLLESETAMRNAFDEKMA